MGGIITAAVITAGVAAGSSIYSGRQSAKGAAAAAAAEAEQRELLMQRIIGASTDAASEVRSLAEDYLEKSNAEINRYRKVTYKLSDEFQYTEVPGMLEPDENGVSQFDKAADLIISSDRKRRERVLGDAEPSIEVALGKWAKLAGGDFSGFLGELRSSEAAIAANTRGGPIGTFANLSARNRLDFMREGTGQAIAVGSFLESFETDTPTVFQTALQVSDEKRREASRFDANENQKVLTKLNIEQSTLNGRLGMLNSFTSMNVNAANALATALVGGAQAGFTGSGGAGLSNAFNAQAAAGVASAVGSAASSYIQYSQQQQTNDLLRANLNANTTTTTATTGTGGTTTTK